MKGLSDPRDTEQMKAILRQCPTARQVRERFPAGTCVRGRVGGQTGIVMRHIPLTDARAAS